MRRRRTISPVLPAEIGSRDGLAYSLWLPPGAERARNGVLVLHGAGSQKESHHDFARAASAAGLATLCFDQRGHGASGGRMGGAVLDDVAAMALRLREALTEGGRIALRGSSMGGYLAVVGAAACRAAAVVAICPASASGLRRGLTEGRLDFPADKGPLLALLASHPIDAAVGELPVPVLIMHAEGDEVVPVEQSRELAGHFRHPLSRLIAVPGGHHRSIQHDADLQAVSLRFLTRALADQGS